MSSVTFDSPDEAWEEARSAAPAIVERSFERRNPSGFEFDDNETGREEAREAARSIVDRVADRRYQTYQAFLDLEAESGGGEYDPGDYTITDVQQYVTDNPDERSTVRDLEAEGKARTTLLDWLDTA